MLALANANIKFPTPGDFWSGTFEDFFAAIDIGEQHYFAVMPVQKYQERFWEQLQ